MLVGEFLNSGQFITGRYSVNQLLNHRVIDDASFGPQLIVNGKNEVTPAIDAAWGWAPRTVIGQEEPAIGDDHHQWPVIGIKHIGGRNSDMTHMFKTYHIVNAIEIDGGVSTTMIKSKKEIQKINKMETVHKEP
jgi:exopolysaccharide biosynthesis protein